MVADPFYKEKKHESYLSNGNENVNKNSPSYPDGGTREGA